MSPWVGRASDHACPPRPRLRRRWQTEVGFSPRRPPTPVATICSATELRVIRKAGFVRIRDATRRTARESVNVSLDDALVVGSGPALDQPDAATVSANGASGICACCAAVCRPGGWIPLVLKSRNSVQALRRLIDLAKFANHQGAYAPGGPRLSETYWRLWLAGPHWAETRGTSGSFRRTRRARNGRSAAPSGNTRSRAAAWAGSTRIPGRGERGGKTERGGKRGEGERP